MDVKDETKDVVLKGEDSKGERLGDSTTQKVYTENEVEAKFSQQRSVLDRKIAGLEKTVDSYKGKDAEVTQLKSDLQQMRKEIEDRQLEAIGNDPDAKKEWQEKKSVKDERAKLNQDKTDFERGKAEHEEALKELNESKLEKVVLEIANRLTVDTQPILKYVKKVPDASPEDIEEFAETLPKKGEEKQPLKLGSGRMIGGVGWRDLSPDEKILQGLTRK